MGRQGTGTTIAGTALDSAEPPTASLASMTDNELPITGYLDRFSHRPGETFTAFVSVRDGGTVSRPAGARAERRSQSGWPRRALRGPVASLRSVARRPPAGDPSRLLRHRRARARRATRKQPAPGPCWCVRGWPDAGQVIAGGGSRRCQHRAADRRERRDGADRRRRRRDIELATGAPMQARALVSRLARRRPGDAAASSSDSSRWMARRRSRRSAGARARAAIGRHGAVRGGECRGPAASFHRQAGGPRDPARLRDVLARCRRDAGGAGAGTARRLGFLAAASTARRSPTSARRRATAIW